MPGYVDGWPHPLGSEKGYTLDDTGLALATRLAAMHDTGTTLPSSPFEGQRFVLQTATMKAAHAAWHCEYDSTMPGTAKWQVIGGSPWHVETTAAVDIVTSNQPTFVLPSAPLEAAVPSGIYVVEHGIFNDGDMSGTVYAEVGVSTPGGGPTRRLHAIADMSLVPGEPVHFPATARRGVAAGTLRQYLAWNNATGANLSRRYMTITPLALGGTS